MMTTGLTLYGGWYKPRQSLTGKREITGGKSGVQSIWPAAVPESGAWLVWPQELPGASGQSAGSDGQPEDTHVHGEPSRFVTSFEAGRAVKRAFFT